jgi:hypothetical protein
MRLPIDQADHQAWRSVPSPQRRYRRIGVIVGSIDVGDECMHIVCFCADGRDAYPGHNLLAGYTGWQVPLADADARPVLPCARGRALSVPA